MSAYRTGRSARRFVDLFAGAGGLSEGLRASGWIPLLGTDIDPDACATYQTNFTDASVLWGDVRSPEIRSQVVELAGRAHILVGGPPCQGFSQVRNHSRLIDDPRNSLYREFVELVAQTEPMAFIMENVPGMAQMGVAEQVESDLTCAGRYRVHSMLLDAADFGVPQTRKRIVFVGFHSDLGVAPPHIVGTGASAAIALNRPVRDATAIVSATSGSLFGTDLLAQLADPWDDRVVSVRQALSDLAVLESVGYQHDSSAVGQLGPVESVYQKLMRDDGLNCVTNTALPRINDDTRIRLEAIPPGGNYLDLPDELLDRFLTGKRWGQSNGSGRLSRKHFYAYRRLHPDIWSWTINTKADSVYHWKKPRALAVRELARLQSFPDRYVFTTDERRGDLEGRVPGGAAHSRYRQVGNAVPPLLARAVARAIDELLPVS